MIDPKPPPNTMRFFPASILISLSITIWCIPMVMPGYRGPAAAVMSCLSITAILVRSLPAVHITIFSFLTLAFPVIWRAGFYWPWTLLVPLIVYHSLVIAIPPMRRSLNWMRFGRFDRRICILVLLAIAGSAMALYAWTVVVNPSLSRQLSQFPDIPIYLLPLAGIGFALLNAMMEEFAFRGIIMQALDSVLSTEWLSIVVQALPFGLFHYAAGFPNGISGVFMTFIYGIVMGIVRHQSTGMLAPVITHFFADLTIFAILASLMSGTGAAG